MLVEVIKKLIELLKKHNAWGRYAKLRDPYIMAQIDVLCELLANYGVLVHVDKVILGSRFGSKMNCTCVLKSVKDSRSLDRTIFTGISFDFNECVDGELVNDLTESLIEFNPIRTDVTGFMCHLKGREAN